MTGAQFIAVSSFLLYDDMANGGERRHDGTGVLQPAGKMLSYILREIEQAKKELLVAVYAFTSEDLATALVQAKKRGIIVQIVVDREFDLANEKSSKGKFFDTQKIPLRRISGTKSNVAEKDSGLMHQKFAVIDRKVVFSGSYNWTHSADNSNDENLLLFRDAGPWRKNIERRFFVSGSANREPLFGRPL